MKIILIDNRKFDAGDYIFHFVVVKNDSGWFDPNKLDVTVVLFVGILLLGLFYFTLFVWVL